jgi:hypothetical protein
LAAQVAVVGATTGAAGVATGDGVGLGVVLAVVVAGAGALAVTTFAGDVAATCVVAGAVALVTTWVAAGVVVGAAGATVAFGRRLNHSFTGCSSVAMFGSAFAAFLSIPYKAVAPLYAARCDAKWASMSVAWRTAADLSSGSSVCALSSDALTVSLSRRP